MKNTLKLYDEAIDDFSKSIELEYKKEPSIISSMQFHTTPQLVKIGIDDLSIIVIKSPKEL